MKVSVVITTYNQEKFIGEALNSALAQEVDFDYEVIVGEDASTDRTRDIVLEFQQKYPQIIRPLLTDPAIADRNRELGIGGKTALLNCLKACRGEYIALLDGDDYWTDRRKLQKQVDFLDSHPDFAVCFHDVLMTFDDGHTAARRFSSPDRKAVSTIEDLMSENFIPTCSAVFRRRPMDEFPDWFFTARTGDWAMHVIHARHGKIGYINEVMGVYRIHSGGFWSLSQRVSQLVDAIRTLDTFNQFLNFQYERRIRPVKGRLYYQLADECYARGHLGFARSFLKQSYSLGFRQRNMLNLLLRLQAPGIHRFLKRSRGLARDDETPKQRGNAGDALV